MMNGLLTSRRSYILCLLVVLQCIFVVGCSGVVYDRGFKAEGGINKWADSGKGPGQFNLNGYNLRIRDHDERDSSCSISIGPPFLPVFPLFFSCFGGRQGLTLQLAFENSYEALTVDVQSAKLLESGGRIIPISRAEYHAAKAPIAHTRYVEPFVLGKGTFTLDLYYDDAGKPDEVTFEFGNMFSAGETIVAAPLIFQSDNKFRFCLLAISHGCSLGNF